MLTLIVAATIGATSPAGDIPPGTDVMFQVQVGQLAGEARKIWKDIEPLLAAWPPASQLRSVLTHSWDEAISVVSQRLGLDLSLPKATLTLNIDLDATGGVVVGGVLRGALREQTESPPESDEIQTFQVDGQPAYRFANHDLQWSVMDDKSLVVGNARGMQRQLRRLLHPNAHDQAGRDEPEIETLAGRLRDRAPLAIAFTLPTSTRQSLSLMWSTAGPLLSRVRSGTLLARKRDIRIHLASADDKGQEAVAHGISALVALTRASVSLMEAGGEVLLGLDTIGKRPPKLAKALDNKLVKTLLSSWLRGAVFDAKIGKRPQHVTEARIRPSSYRALLASIGMMTVMALPSVGAKGRHDAQALLIALRKAELKYRAHSGDLVACGPVPRQLPHAPVDWPKESCFDRIGFRPNGKVHFQLGAAISQGKLLLMARGDSNGDGVPEVWVLGENSPQVAPFAPPTGTAGRPPF